MGISVSNVPFITAFVAGYGESPLSFALRISISLDAVSAKVSSIMLSISA